MYLLFDVDQFLSLYWMLHIASVWFLLLLLLFLPKAPVTLAPWPGITRSPPALEGEVLTTRLPGKSKLSYFDCHRNFCRKNSVIEKVYSCFLSQHTKCNLLRNGTQRPSLNHVVRTSHSPVKRLCWGAWGCCALGNDLWGWDHFHFSSLWKEGFWAVHRNSLLIMFICCSDVLSSTTCCVMWDFLVCPWPVTAPRFPELPGALTGVFRVFDLEK